MPKEIIRDMHNGRSFDVIGPNNEMLKSDPEYRYLKLGWDRQGGVSLVIWQSTDLSTPEPHENPDFDGPWLHLDRGEINRLIEALRKARDQAYGKDA